MRVCECITESETPTHHFMSSLFTGMEIWGNMISTGCPNPQQYNFTIPVSYDDTFTCEVNNNPKLYDSGFEADNYFANNFNSIGESFVTLFECTVVNQCQFKTHTLTCTIVFT